MQFYIFALLFIGITLNDVRARDYRIWGRMHTLIKKHIDLKHTVGIVPTTYDFPEVTLNVSAPQSWHFNDAMYGPDQTNILTGKGFLLKGALDGKPPGKYAPVEIELPGEPKSACGIFLGSRHDAGDDFVEAIKIYWRTDKKMKYRLIADSNTGDFKFKPNFVTSHDFRAIFFDPAPIKYLKIYLYYGNNKRPSIRATILHTCTYPNMKYISRCDEKVEDNKRFDQLPFNTPIHIKCPVDCVLTRPCWGYKVYTSDSPICWTATQNFGRKGRGVYVMYRIAQAVKFNDQINPFKNNLVYCRKYSRRYEAFTFDRKYVDLTIKQYYRLYGA